MPDRQHRPAFPLLLILLVPIACDRPARLARDELPLVADHFEALAHGEERDWRELLVEDGSRALDRLARYARGRVVTGRSTEPPVPFDRRRRRWPLLAAAMSEGQVAVDELGQLHLADEVGPTFEELLITTLSDENTDRMQAITLLVGHAGLDPRTHRAKRLIALIRETQVHHARQQGAHRWRKPSGSTSENAATPSTSAQTSSRTSED